MKKTRIMEFFGEPLNYGGQELFMINMYNNLSESIDFTFVTPFEATNTRFKNMIKNKKDKLFVDNKKFETKFRKKHILETAKKYITNEYDIIHIHSGSVFTLCEVAKIAKKKGVKKIIVHSHCTGTNTFKYKLIKWYSDKRILKYANVFLACSDEAAKWKFPKKIVDNKQYFIIKNGIDLDKFKFDFDVRNQIRKKLKIQEKDVICNVGRFSNQKNHQFILDVFYEYQKKNNAYLILIGGSGNLENEINEKIRNLNLDDKVLVLKNIDNVQDYLQASDVFLFPSLFEGLGIVALESQAVGLPILCSENIPKDVFITDICKKLNLNDDINDWCSQLSILKQCTRESKTSELKLNGYDIVDSAITLEKIYGGEL